MFIISKETIDRLLDALGTLPYRQVESLIRTLKEAETSKTETVKESKTRSNK